MAKPKMHSLHKHIPSNEGSIRTAECWRSVPSGQIAAFESGVTCKACLAAIKFSRESAGMFTKKPVEVPDAGQ